MAAAAPAPATAPAPAPAAEPAPAPAPAAAPAPKKVGRGGIAVFGITIIILELILCIILLHNTSYKFTGSIYKPGTAVYSVNDTGIVEMSSGSTDNSAHFKVTDISIGQQLKTFTIDEPGTNYAVDDTGNFNGGSGSGTYKVTSIGAGGLVTGLEILTSQDFIVNDVCKLFDAGDSNAEIKVTAIESSGEIKSFEITTFGDGDYTNGNHYTLNSGKTPGTESEITFDSEQDNRIHVSNFVVFSLVQLLFIMIILRYFIRFKELPGAKYDNVWRYAILLFVCLGCVLILPLISMFFNPDGSQYRYKKKTITWSIVITGVVFFLVSVIFPLMSFFFGKRDLNIFVFHDTKSQSQNFDTEIKKEGLLGADKNQKSNLSYIDEQINAITKVGEIAAAVNVTGITDNETQVI